jgi:hypothetical protein
MGKKFMIKVMIKNRTGSTIEQNFTEYKDAKNFLDSFDNDEKYIYTVTYTDKMPEGIDSAQLTKLLISGDLTSEVSQ